MPLPHLITVISLLYSKFSKMLCLNMQMRLYPISFFLEQIDKETQISKIYRGKDVKSVLDFGGCSSSSALTLYRFNLRFIFAPSSSQPVRSAASPVTFQAAAARLSAKLRFECFGLNFPAFHSHSLSECSTLNGNDRDSKYNFNRGRPVMEKTVKIMEFVECFFPGLEKSRKTKYPKSFRKSHENV